jgi:hypothetical protein
MKACRTDQNQIKVLQDPSSGLTKAPEVQLCFIPVRPQAQILKVLNTQKPLRPQIQRTLSLTHAIFHNTISPKHYNLRNLLKP